MSDRLETEMRNLPLSVNALSFDSSSDIRLFSRTSSVLMVPLVVVVDVVVDDVVIVFVVVDDDDDAVPIVRVNLLSINILGSFDSAD